MMVNFYMYHVVLCDGLSLPNGEIYYDLKSVNGQYLVGTTAYFFCDLEYKLVGSDNATCAPSRNWNNQSYCELSNKILQLMHFHLS